MNRKNSFSESDSWHDQSSSNYDSDEDIQNKSFLELQMKQVSQGVAFLSLTSYESSLFIGREWAHTPLRYQFQQYSRTTLISGYRDPKTVTLALGDWGIPKAKVTLNITPPKSFNWRHVRTKKGKGASVQRTMATTLKIVCQKVFFPFLIISKKFCATIYYSFFVFFNGTGLESHENVHLFVVLMVMNNLR